MVAGKLKAGEGQPDFTEIDRQFRPRIIRLMTRMVGEDESEDLTQVVMLKVARGLPRFRGKSTLSTWVYRIAVNVAKDRIKERMTEGLMDLHLGQELAPGNFIPLGTVQPVERQVIRGEMNACIRSVVDRLPEAYRTAIILSDLEGFKDAEMAKILGLSLQAAKIRIHRARERLRKELSSYCTFYRDERNELACDVKRNNGDA